MIRRLTRATTRRQRPAGACGMDRLLTRLAFVQRKPVPTDIACSAPATRKVSLGNGSWRVCLWHSLVAVNQLDARLVETPETVSS